MSPTSSLPAWFARAIEAFQEGNTDGWMAIYAPDAIHEFPFAPEGGPRRLEGRDAIAAYMRRLPEFIRFEALSDVRVREAGKELIIEATGHHQRISDNAPRELSYVWFITLRDGKVTHFRDYMNPLQLSAPRPSSPLSIQT
jgi:ketosteroid isomerase-like protein